MLLLLILLILLSPILLTVFIVLAVMTRGKPLFSQERVGHCGRRFRMYKFRTMRLDADKFQHLVQNEKDGPIFKNRCDPRVTKLGRWLRKTSIDEMPQLVSVLLGDMSLVGPRPHALAHDQEYSPVIANYAYRHHVKPGITGWAQVNGFRGGTPRLEQMAKRIELDLWYIDNWSFALDFLIILRTLVEVLRNRNAF